MRRGATAPLPSRICYNRAVLARTAAWMVGRTRIVAAAALAMAACRGRAAEQPAVDPAGSAALATDAAATTMDIEQARFDEERRPDLIVAALGICSIRSGSHAKFWTSSSALWVRSTSQRNISRSRSLMVAI